MPLVDGVFIDPEAWEDLKKEMRNSPHPCGSHAFCRMVQSSVREYQATRGPYPHYSTNSFPTPDQPTFLSWMKDCGWYKPHEYMGGLLGKITKATNKRTAQAVALAWPLWRDGPRTAEDIEDIQVIMYWLEMFRGCAITRGTYSWHKFYLKRIQELLAEYDKAVRSVNHGYS